VRIDVIEEPDAFAALKANWNAVYDADPTAQLFLSWDWLLGWLPQLQGSWLILAARQDKPSGEPYCAFLPLRIETRLSEGGVFVNDFKMAGNHAADYTGLIALPSAEARAVAAFGRFLKQMHWARLHLDNFRASRPRLDLLLAHFPKAGFATTEVDRVDKVDGIDLNTCPYVDLPSDWESYLAGLSTNARQKIRRLLRLADDGGSEFRITHATQDTVARDLDVLLRFWALKWGQRKGNKLAGLVRSNRDMLLRSFERGLLFLPVLWQGDRPLAALATLVDLRRRTLLFYMTGRDETFDGPSPGLMLHGHSIRHAIANGFTRYDFLRGDEDYKYSFGAREARIATFIVATRDGRNNGHLIEPRALPVVLKQATAMHQAGKLNEAQRGYQQVLASAPRHPDALHRLGQLLTARGQHLEAMRIFRQLCRARPEATKAWLSLAQACEAAGRYREAVNAYRELVARAPDVPAFAGKLGEMLAKVVKDAQARGSAAEADDGGVRAPRDPTIDAAMMAESANSGVAGHRTAAAN